MISPYIERHCGRRGSPWRESVTFPTVKHRNDEIEHQQRVRLAPSRRDVLAPSVELVSTFRLRFAARPSPQGRPIFPRWSKSPSHTPGPPPSGAKEWPLALGASTLVPARTMRPRQEQKSVICLPWVLIGFSRRAPPAVG